MRRSLRPFSPDQLPGLELSSSADGRLFGYSQPRGFPTGTLFEIDKRTAVVSNGQDLAVTTESALAFSYFHGKFIFFTTPAGRSSTVVTRFDPALMTFAAAGSLTGESLVHTLNI